MSQHLAEQYKNQFSEQVDLFLTDNSDIERVELLYPDNNGVMRGKWLPASSLKKLADGAVRLPRSTSFLDIWSDDVDETGMVIDIGDPDCICLPVASSLCRVPWASKPSAQVLISMFEPQDMEGSVYEARQILQRQILQYEAMGLTPVVATELEFYIVDPQHSGDKPQPPLGQNGERSSASQIYEYSAMDNFAPLLDAINQAGQEQGLPLDTTIAEFGPGQFEINLLHQANPLLAADQAVMLKHLIKQVVREHGYEATFMAKPYTEFAGNGMHVHASVNDAEGNNIFASDTDELSKNLADAIAGLLATMEDTQLLYAPHANSYRRFIPGSYAPISPCWGFDHRAAAVRVPAIKGKAARLEHRVSGADANPYLVISAILAGMHSGLLNHPELMKPISSDTKAEDLAPMTGYWGEAIHRFENSAFVSKELGAEFQRVMGICKCSEERKFAAQVTDFECQTYLSKA